MASKSVLKFIKSLKIKKYRDRELRFVVEGSKSVLEVMQSDFRVEIVLGTDTFEKRNQAQIQAVGAEFIAASQKELEAVGTLKSNDAALAVCLQKENLPPTIREKEYALALDAINDPGNLGTVIRVADWYGFRNIICSPTTTDFYSPKVIQASVGSFCRVMPYYTDLVSYLPQLGIPLYGTFLEGEDLHQMEFNQGGVVILGSESHGISSDLEALVDTRICIRGFGGAESLNVGVAAGVVCDSIRRVLDQKRD